METDKPTQEEIGRRVLAISRALFPGPVFELEPPRRSRWDRLRSWLLRWRRRGRRRR